MKHGFLKNDVKLSVNSDIFLCHHKNIYIKREDLLDIRAYTVDIGNKLTNLRSSIGEFFEREVLINCNQDKNEYINVYSLLSGDKSTIKKNKVIFKNEFVDSSGMASHVDSSKLILNATLEFFERQCLILNYLSKMKGSKVNLVINKSEELLKYDTYIKSYVDNIDYYDISLSEHVHVILAIGIGDTNKCVGLGTSCDLFTAINKSQQEMLQYFASTVSVKNKNTLGIKIYYEENVKDHYHHKFDSLTPKEVSNLYSYLTSSPDIDYKKLHISKSTNLKDLITDINSRYNINPYVAFFQNQRFLSNVKVCKIIDFNWFPHMNPKLYSKELLDNISNITKTKLDYECSFIPFP